MCTCVRACVKKGKSLRSKAAEAVTSNCMDGVGFIQHFTHLFEHFHFGAQSLDGLVILAFEVVRKARARKGRGVGRGIGASRVWRRTSRVGWCRYKRRVGVKPEGSARYAVPVEMVGFCSACALVDIRAYLWVIVGLSCGSDVSMLWRLTWQSRAY